MENSVEIEVTAEAVYSCLYMCIEYINNIALDERDLEEAELDKLERYYELAGKAKRIAIEQMQENTIGWDEDE